MNKITAHTPSSTIHSKVYPYTYHLDGGTLLLDILASVLLLGLVSHIALIHALKTPSAEKHVPLIVLAIRGIHPLISVEISSSSVDPIE